MIAIAIIVIAALAVYVSNNSQNNGSNLQGKLPPPGGSGQRGIVSNVASPIPSVPAIQNALNINRAELVKLLVTTKNIPINTAGGPHFSDVSPQSWAYPYVETAYNKGWLHGFNVTFSPNIAIPRVLALMLYDRVFLAPPIPSGNDPACQFPDVAQNTGFYSLVNRACHYKIIDTVPGSKFFPHDYLSKLSAQWWITAVKNSPYNLL